MFNVYLIGNGYVCDYITSLGSKKYKYIGLCRSQKNNCDKNIQVDILKDTSKLKGLINEDSYVVYLVPPQQSGAIDQVINNFLKHIQRRERIKKIIYISTSGVYGDKNDKEVDENSSLQPLTDRAKRRVSAEKQVIESNLNYTILRVPGIYGYGRLPINRIKQRLPLINLDICRHTNLIHAKDLAKIIVSSIENKNTINKVINVSDGSAIKSTQYYLHIYDALKKPYPEFIDYEAAEKLYDEKRKSFIKESRKLDTSLMNKIFPDIIEYKDLREGIKDSLKEE